MKIPKDKIKRLEIFSVITVGIVIVALFIFPNIKVPIFEDNPAIPKITGYVPADMFSQNLNLEFTESSKYTLSINSNEPFTMTSLRVDGAVEGDGVIKITLIGNADNAYTVYTNIKKDIGKGNLITGMAVADTDAANAEESIALKLTKADTLPEFVADVAEGYKAAEGSFTNECIDTCYINLPFEKDTEYELIFEVEKDTKLRIDKIIYTVA